jgi:carbon starvation protein
MLQDVLGHVHPLLGRTSWMPGVLMTSSAVVLAWGYFLYQGVRDPLGGINSLWPLFGIANQLLAAIALCVATTILIKMHRARYIWITGLPLLWLVTVTFTAAWQKIFSPMPRIGFLAQARQLQAALGSGSVTGAKIAETQTLIFNARLDAVVCGVFMILVAIIIVDSLRIWTGILAGSRSSQVVEAPFVLSRFSTEEA